MKDDDVIAEVERLRADRCPRCGYERRDDASRCPECGLDADVAADWRRRGTPRSRWRRSIIATAILLWGPQTWVILMPGAWHGYRLSWIKMFPILPGLLPSLLVRRFGSDSDALMFVVATIITLLLAGTAIWIASRGLWRLIMIEALLALYGTATAFILHGLYAA